MNISRTKLQRLASVAASISLGSYIIFLLFTHYLSQVKTEEFSVRLLKHHIEEHAEELSIFFEDRNQDLIYLSEMREIDVFFENRALGMSMEYGLRNSLANIDRSFRQCIENNWVGDQQCYSQVALSAKDGTLLVTSKPKDSDVVEEWDQDLISIISSFQEGDTALQMFCEHDGAELKVTLCVPYYFKGVFTGYVLASISRDLDYHELLRIDHNDSEWVTWLISPNGYTPLHLSEESELRFDSSISAISDNQYSSLSDTSRVKDVSGMNNLSDMFGIQVTVEGTPFSLVVAMPENNVPGVAKRSYLLMAMGILAALLVVGTPLLWRISTKNLVLSTRLDEESRSKRGVEIINKQLELEIVERKKIEKQRRELQDKLERAERMESLGILAGGVAHDLNNMLGPIVGYSELILMQMDKDDKVSEKVRRIGKSAQDAANVIQDLLTLARRGRYEMVPTDFNQVVVDYIETPGFLKLTDENPDVELSINLDKSINHLMGSSAHLAKAIMNLVINAFDAMSDGGTLSISTSRQNLEELSKKHKLGNIPGDYLMVSIADTGKGIDPESLDKIFEPYYSKKKMGCSSGSGLGLSVVYGVVKDHKGYYDIITSLGKGTEFQLFFPVIAVTETDKEEVVEEDLSGTESILIVDDNNGQREVAAEILLSLGYEVHTAISGEAAVEFFKDTSVDLVLLDMIMDPGIDGLDTYREIIKLHPGQKAVIASGFSATTRVKTMQSLGAGQYIKKPYSIRNIGQAIRQELTKHSEQIPISG